MFGLLICLAAGIHPIITSSSDRKLDLARNLGQQNAIDVINYSKQPKWDEEALRLTNGRGVDIVFEIVGVTTVAQSLSCLARRGTVSLIGFLGGFSPDQFPDTIGPLLVKSATIRGVAVGSKLDQLNLYDFLTEKKIRLEPIMDRVFPFEDSQAAFDYLFEAKHMGKVVIKM